jgi:hypothetical protein
VRKGQVFCGFHSEGGLVALRNFAHGRKANGDKKAWLPVFFRVLAALDAISDEIRSDDRCHLPYGYPPTALLFRQGLRRKELAEAQNFGALMARDKFAAAGPRDPLCA